MVTPIVRLRWFLVVLGFVMLTALVPAVMPFAWMNFIHATLGLGNLPDAPIVHYLTRSCSMLYACGGALILYLAMDVRRHVEIIRLGGILTVVGGVGLAAIDLNSGLPWFWVAGEGPCVVALGVVMRVL
ncbi:MAG: hypothetical protein V1809_12865, partial [Planctomycetota bacterium]